MHDNDIPIFQYYNIEILHLQQHVKVGLVTSRRQILFRQMLISEPICLQKIFKTNKAKYSLTMNISPFVKEIHIYEQHLKFIIPKCKRCLNFFTVSKNQISLDHPG